MANGKQIVSEYLAGRCAARDGKPIPADASDHFLDGYNVVRRELAVSAAGWAFKNGELTEKQWIAAVRSP